MDANGIVAYAQANWLPFVAGGTAGISAGVAMSHPGQIAIAGFRFALKYVPGFQASIRKNPKSWKAGVEEVRNVLDAEIDKEDAADEPAKPPVAAP